MRKSCRRQRLPPTPASDQMGPIVRADNMHSVRFEGLAANDSVENDCPNRRCNCQALT